MAATVDAAAACKHYEASHHALAPYWTAAVGPEPVEDNFVHVFHRTPGAPRHPGRPTSVSLVAGEYDYVEGGAYVNFAAQQLGGGVLGQGFVQEEVGTFESNLLPLLYDGSLHLNNDLRREPAVLSVLRLFRLKARFYGSRGRDELLKLDPTVLQPDA